MYAYKEPDRPRRLVTVTNVDPWARWSTPLKSLRIQNILARNLKDLIILEKYSLRIIMKIIMKNMKYLFILVLKLKFPITPPEPDLSEPGFLFLKIASYLKF